MNQDQRKQLIQAMVSGDITTIQDLREEISGSEVSREDFFPAAIYLLKHGTPKRTHYLPEYDDYPVIDPEYLITSPGDLIDLEEGLNAYCEKASYENVSLKAFWHMVEAAQCYLILDNEGQLEQLDQYRGIVFL